MHVALVRQCRIRSGCRRLGRYRRLSASCSVCLCLEPLSLGLSLGLSDVVGARIFAGLQPTGEISQAALKSRDKVWGDGWLPFGVTARWLGARLIRFVDAERYIQQLVGVR